MAAPEKPTLGHKFTAFFFNRYWAYVKSLPFDVASERGSALARRFGPLSGAHKTAQRNIRMVFPNISAAEEEEMLEAMWDNLGRIMGEMPHLGAIPLFGDGARTEVTGIENLDRYLAKGVGAVFVSGHFANWEVMPSMIVRRGIDCEITYRPVNNPYIDKVVVDARAAYGVTLFAPKGPGGGMRLMRILKRGGSVALMNDQKYDEGISSPFLGHQAMTNDAAIRLAHKFRVPVQFMSLGRTNGVNFAVDVPAPFFPDFDAPLEEAVRAGVDHINDYLSGIIMANPAQYFWVHKRWPRQAWIDAGVMD